MITADIRRATWDAAQAAAAAGELPPVITSPARNQPVDASTLRPVPRAPGQYTSTLPYRLAAPGAAPARIAAILASRLTSLPWIARATATTGHLTITVTDAALAALAVRVAQADDCARSDILRGMTVPAPATAADLAASPSWQDARARLTAEITGRLASKAGAKIFSERLAPADSRRPQRSAPVAAALAYAGHDAVRYALISRADGWPDGTSVELLVRYHLSNPVYAVRYAHAHAASTLRQAADLGLGAGDADQFAARLLSQQHERALLGAMSWLPERVAWAARRGRPGEFARYLAELAGAYHDCRENCPALPFGGHSAPRDPGTIRARLWLVTAARTAIAAGLGLIGVSAPDRL